MMRTAIAFGPYNVIIMRSITDRVTRAKSDTQEFRNMMRTAIAFGPYNVIIMRSITDRVTRAKSDTQEFRNKRLCSSTLWEIYKE